MRNLSSSNSTTTDMPHSCTISQIVQRCDAPSSKVLIKPCFTKSKVYEFTPNKDLVKNVANWIIVDLGTKNENDSGNGKWSQNPEHQQGSTFSSRSDKPRSSYDRAQLKTDI